MSEKVIDIPNVGQIAFPDSMSDADINAAAAKLYAEKNPQHPPPHPQHSWVDTAVDWLPTVAGAAGGMIGATAGPVGAVGGAATGGMVGGALKQGINALRGVETPKSAVGAVGELAKDALQQGAMEAVGPVIGTAMRAAAPALMQSALKPSMRASTKAIIRGEAPPVVQTMLREGISVSPRGMAKLNLVLNSTNDEIKTAIAAVGADVNPFKVTSKLGETAKTFATQVNPTADLEAISRVGNEFLETHPRLTVQEAQAVKQGTYRQLGGKYGELKSAEVEAQKALARGLKDEIAEEVANSNIGIRGRAGLPGGVDITALNAREGAALEAQKELAKRLAVTERQNPMGLASLAVSHPVTFLTALADRSPAVKSLIAKGAYRAAGSVARVSPQLIRAAVETIATSGTGDAGPR